MINLRLKLAVVAAVLAGLAIADIASAELSDDLVYGLQLYGVRFQKKYDPLTKGYALNVSFTDPNTGLPFYNDTNFYLGIADLTLGTDAPGTIKTSAIYSTRWVPAVRFGMKTVDPQGNSNPLSYKFHSFLFGQDFTVTGSLLMDTDVYINKWGSYDITLQASNRSTVTMQGVTDPSKLPNFDYDVGPISLSGNIYLDALAVIADPFFEKFGAENPFARFGGGLADISLKATSVEDLIARLEAGQLLSDDDLSKIVNNSVLSSALGKEPSSDLFTKLVLPEGLLDPQPLDCEQCGRISALAVPEPGMLALLATVGAGFYLSPHRRRRSR
jgi:hypothetical protein